MISRSKYSVAKKYYDEIWGDILLRGKTAKFLKRLFRLRKRKYLPRWKRFFNFNITYRLRLRFPKTSYGKLLVHKQKIKKFYSTMTEHQFRQLFIRSNRHSKYWIQYFYYQLERRVDTILYRINFALNISMARRLITAGLVYLNERAVSKPAVALSVGDSLQLQRFRRCWLRLLRKLRRRRIFMYHPSYFEVNYKTFTALLFERPLGGQIFFPFHFSNSRFANFYRSK